MSNKLVIGLFGFGTVGKGLYEVLKNTTSINATIKKIVIKNKDKERDLPIEYFSTSKFEILNDPEINTVVELIDDAEAAFIIVKQALQHKKNVVTANKKMVATHLQELIDLQKQNNVSLLYEAAVCGSIPIIRTLEEYFDNEILNSLSGIFNGTTNYILTKTINEGLDYDQALSKAKELGFAESNPVSDVEGYDAKYKLVIAAAHAHGIITPPNKVLNWGISQLQATDINYAKEKNYKIKLVPYSLINNNSIALFVLPKFIDATNYLYNVNNEDNGVVVDGKYSDKQFFQGKGAGGYPTGSAVLSDISALIYNYKYSYKKLDNCNLKYTSNIIIEIYFRYNNGFDIALIKFESILENFKSISYGFLIAKIKLSELLAQKEFLQSENIFIATLGNQVTFINKELKNADLENVLA
jgi:homoserine dehydrogenase